MRFSAIICTYNQGHFLEYALRSVAAQKFSDFEFIIVDDGSTDNTEEIVRSYSESVRQCNYVKKANAGLAHSRNVGIQTATGTHIVFLDADDAWSPDYLAVLRDYLLRSPQAEVICCDGFNILDSNIIAGNFFPPEASPVSGPLHTARELFGFFPYTSICATAFSKSAFDRVGLYDTRFALFGQDWHWLFRAVAQGIFFVRLEHKVALYRRHGGNLTNRTDRMFEAWIESYADTLGRCADAETVEYARRFTYRLLTGILARYSADTNRRLLNRAIEVFPGDAVIRAALVATSLGATTALRPILLLKQTLRRIRGRNKPKVNWCWPPEEMFERLNELC